MRKFLLLPLLCCVHIHIEAAEVTAEELPFLPSYCRGTQLIRAISGDTTPFEVYVRQMGSGFMHLHHYCWALNSERKAINAPKTQINGNPSRQNLLDYSLANVDYVLHNTDNSFVLIPEILTTKARILGNLGRREEAIRSLNDAIRIRPDYWVAYIKLSDIYRDTGDSNEAIKVLESGLSHSPGNDVLLLRLRKLGAEPDPKYLSPPPESSGHDSTSAGRPGNTSAQLPVSNDGGEADQEAQSGPAFGNQQNPYCRFCAE